MVRYEPSLSESSRLPLMREFPFSTDDAECDIFIRRPSKETQKDGVFITRFADDPVRWGN